MSPLLPVVLRAHSSYGGEVEGNRVPRPGGGSWGGLSVAMGKALGSGEADECRVQVMQDLNCQFESLDFRGFPKHVGILDSLFFGVVRY